MTEYKSKVIILGSGPAGATAAIYAARANLKPIMIRGSQPGGQMTITTEVENFPGFAETIQGPWLMEQMEKQAGNVGANIIDDHIISVDFSSRPFKLKGQSDNDYIADSVIICTGAEAKWLGIPSEEKFQGFGVSGCATCDGFFYRGKEVLVVGGGNTAVEEALYLTNHASKVTLIHRRDSLRSEKVLQDRLLSHKKVEVKWNTVLEEVIGEDDPFGVTGAKLKNLKTDKIEDFAVDGIFIAIGHKPNTDLFVDILDMDSEGYLITKPNSTITNIEGIFAAGDVQDKIFRQAVTAAGTGCMAALEVQKFIEE